MKVNSWFRIGIIACGLGVIGLSVPIDTAHAAMYSEYIPNVTVHYRWQDGSIYRTFYVPAEEGTILDASDLEMLPDNMEFKDDFMHYQVKDYGHRNVIERIVKKRTADNGTQTDTPKQVDGATQTDTPKQVDGATQTDTPKQVDGATQTDKPRTFEKGTQVDRSSLIDAVTLPDEVPDTKDASTQTEPPKEDKDTQTEPSKEDKGTQTEPSKEDKGTQTEPSKEDKDKDTQTEPSKEDSTPTKTATQPGTLPKTGSVEASLLGTIGVSLFGLAELFAFIKRKKHTA